MRGLPVAFIRDRTDLRTLCGLERPCGAARTHVDTSIGGNGIGQRSDLDFPVR